MNLKNRLRKLEQTKRQVTAEADCICFPPEEPPDLELQPEIEAAKAVRCPLHGERFKELAPTIYRVIRLPARASMREHVAASARRSRQGQAR